MRQGNFSELLTQAKPVVIHNPLDPAHAPFPRNVMPSSLLSAQALKALQYLPLPNAPGTINNYIVNAPSGNTTDQTIDRIDQSIGEKVRLFFRYAWEDSSLLAGVANPYNGYNQLVNDRNFVIGYTQVITPNAVNDVRFGRQHTTIDSVSFFATSALANAGTLLGIPGFTSSPANPGLPDLAITGYDSVGGGNMASTPLPEEDIAWQGTDVFNWTHGAHSIAAGVEIRKLITNRTANNNPRGLLSFSGQYAGDGAADFMLGDIASVTTPGPLYPGGAQEYRDGFFVTDKWQASQKLTLTLGLPYEMPRVPESTTGNGTILDPTDTHFIPTTVPKIIPFEDPTHKDFAPRAGLAYRISNKWVVRSGFGLYYNPNQLNNYTLTSTNPPFSTIYTYTGDPNTPTLTLAAPIPPTPPGASSYPSAFTINPHLPTAYLNQWSFDLERALWRGGALDIEYLGSHSVHLDAATITIRRCPGPGNVNARRPSQLFGSIRTIQNDEVSSYNGLNIVYRQQVFHGFSGLMSFTWAHDLDISSDSNNGGATMNPYNWRIDYGNANWDIRRRFVGSWVYELPFFKESQTMVLRNVLGNWQLNGIAIMQTGLPFSVNLSNDQANDGQTPQRPNVIGTAHPDCGQGHLTNCISPNAASVFAVPALYTFGDLGRNTFRGPDMIDFDMSLFKNIRFGEKATLEIRGEMFNIFNHPSFANPSSTLVVTSSTTGAVSLSTLGNITGTSNNPRQIQLGMRLTF